MTNDTARNSASVSDLDAGAMHKDYLRDQRIQRLFDAEARKTRRTCRSRRKLQAPVVVADTHAVLDAQTIPASMQRSARFMAAFLKKTGWRWVDAVLEAQDCQRTTQLDRMYATA
jgi:hypothetical protein